MLSYFRRFVVTDGTSRIDNRPSDSGERVEEMDVLALSAAWACVNLNAGNVASLPLMVYRTNHANDREVARDHPLYRLLHDAPNAEQTPLDFWEGAQASIELKGNAVALKTFGVGGNVVALEPMAWDWTGVRRNGAGEIEYEYKGEKYSSADVLHIRGFGGSPLGGLSTIAAGANTFGLAKAINRTAGSMFRNGIVSSGILTSDKMFPPEKRKEAEGLLQSKFAGALNSGRPMLLDNGLKWEALTINPDDAQMLESRGFSVEEVCRFFDVPPFMIGHTEKSTSWGTGLEQQTLGFVKFKLRRRLRRIEQSLEQQLLTAADRGAGIKIEFNLEGLLRGDSAGRASFYGSGLDKGWLTINEVRRFENLPPVPGGDVPRLQMQNVPITEATGTTPLISD
nr:phage portal protein [Sphingobium boeckii]